MLALRTLRNGLKYEHLLSLRVIDLSVLGKYNIKLHYGLFLLSISQYHSAAPTHKALEFSIPTRDHTQNQVVADTNRKITKLCREGKIYEARELFSIMPKRDVVTWTALISGHIQSGEVEEARELFDRVDAQKNVVTSTVMLSGFLKMNNVFEAERFFSKMPVKNVVALNTMIEGYTKNGLIEKALELFEKMEERNVVSWNLMMSGLVNCGRVDEGGKLFDQLNVRNVISWTVMISGLAQNGRVDEARLLFDKMPERNVISWNAMITGYAQNMRLREAYALFEMMPEKNVATWNTLITGCIKNDKLEMAKKLFADMPEKNVISWTSMMNGHVEFGESEEAVTLFFMMKGDIRVKPNEGTFVTVLRACGDLAAVTQGMQVHQAICKTIYNENEHVISALISMYSKCGELAMAQKFFQNGSKGQRDLVSWNSMIAAYAHHGCGREAITLFEEMQAILKPNEVTYVSLLSACSNAGLVSEGLHYFELLVKDKSIQARDDHFTCIVNLYVRAGRLEEAFQFIEQHPPKTSPHDWATLLFGCDLHGDANMQKSVADKINSANVGTYSLQSDEYNTTCYREDAEELNLNMRNGVLKKQPGCSWIEVGN